MSIHILFQDDWLLAVDKPAGLATVPGGWEKDAPSLVRLLEEDYGRLWVVHRLDKITSGVMVFAHTAEAHRNLNTQFEKRQAAKTYHAIVCGAPGWAEETARMPLRVNVGHGHRTSVDWKKGQTAATLFRVHERFSAHALLEAAPETGRTHQIRAHAAALGFPILGDMLYGAPPTPLIARPALHAYSLTLFHPASGERLTFTAPHSPDFTSALSNLP